MLRDDEKNKQNQFTFVSLLFQWFRHTFDASFTIELSATSHLTSLCRAVGMLWTILRKKCKIGSIRALVRITFFLYHFVIGRRWCFVCILFTRNSLRITVTIIIAVAAATATATGRLFGCPLGWLFERFLLWLDRQNICWNEKKKKINNNSIISLGTQKDLTQLANDNNNKFRWINKSEKIVANDRDYMCRIYDAIILGIKKHIRIMWTG